MIFAIFDIKTNKFINRFNARLVGEPISPSIKAHPLTVPEVVKYRRVENDDTELPSTHLGDNIEPSSSNPSPKKSMLIIDPKDLVGKSFLLLQEDCQRLRVRAVTIRDGYE